MQRAMPLTTNMVSGMDGPCAHIAGETIQLVPHINDVSGKVVCE